jgi:hypothetical protein
MSFVVDGDRILFRTKPGRRYEAILENPDVSIEASTFDNETGEWSSVFVATLGQVWWLIGLRGFSLTVARCAVVRRGWRD